MTLSPTMIWLHSVVVACLLASCVGAFGADWPQFRGISRDGKSPETGLLKSWPEEGPELLWVAGDLGKGYSSAAVAGGTIYITGMVEESGEGVLSAFDLDGKSRWQQPYGPEWNGTHRGTRSTPTVDGERLYLMSGTGRVLCFDAPTGAIPWARDVARDYGGVAPVMGFAESLLVDGDRVFCTPGGTDASVVALDKATGKTIWTTQGFSEQSAYCSPILIERGGRRLVVTITARSIVGLDPGTGVLVWRQSIDPEAEDPNHSVSPVYAEGRLYATSGHGEGGQMLEVSPDGGQVSLKWTDTTLNCLHGGLVLDAGYLYGSNTKGKWICLNAANGTVMYIDKGVGMGSLVYADGMLYCYGEKGTAGLVEATPKGYTLVSSFMIERGKGPHWAHPVISGGRLYLRHDTFLMVFDVKASS